MISRRRLLGLFGAAILGAGGVPPTVAGSSPDAGEATENDAPEIRSAVSVTGRLEIGNLKSATIPEEIDEFIGALRTESLTLSTGEIDSVEFDLHYLGGVDVSGRFVLEGQFDREMLSDELRSFTTPFGEPSPEISESGMVRDPLPMAVVGSSTRLGIGIASAAHRSLALALDDERPESVAPSPAGDPRLLTPDPNEIRAHIDLGPRLTDRIQSRYPPASNDLSAIISQLRTITVSARMRGSRSILTYRLRHDPSKLNREAIASSITTYLDEIESVADATVAPDPDDDRLTVKVDGPSRTVWDLHRSILPLATVREHVLARIE